MPPEFLSGEKILRSPKRKSNGSIRRTGTSISFLGIVYSHHIHHSHHRYEQLTTTEAKCKL